MDRILPLNYKICIEPDLAKLTFTGHVEISLNLTEAHDEITFNALDLDVKKCRVHTGSHTVDGVFEMNPETESLQILLPEKISGEIRLTIDYKARILDKMAGFYCSRDSHGDKKLIIAVTQFEESDARRAFPCLDHPCRKATFDIELIIDQSLTAISNGPVREEKALKKGKKRVCFEQTPKMSTYLVFFGVGEFEFFTDQNDSRVRVAALPGRLAYAAFGADFGAKALHYCENYFDIPYPLSKMDLIAIPDFAFGAMENWGAITFRENLLLHYPGVTSRAGEERIAEVIAHEIVHQWFGNLATPAQWMYLWLNESFATYFGYRVVNHYHPDWETWPQFVQGTTAVALERDGLSDTIAVEIPGGEHVVINASTAPIIYNKGASVLRQVEGFIGKESFQEGLRRYLATHAYGNAKSSDFWQAFEDVSEAPVTAMMKTWVEQPGYPLVTARRKDDRLFLSQKRFTFLPGDSDQIWKIPVTVTVFRDTGHCDRISVLMEQSETAIELDRGAMAYKVNAGHTGFYRVYYEDPENLAALHRRVGHMVLSDLDRWGMENDLFAMLKAGRVPMENYLAFLSAYDAEQAFLPLASQAANLFELFRVTTGKHRMQVAQAGRNLCQRVLDRIGIDPDPGEFHTTSILREQLVWHAALYGAEAITAELQERFHRLTRGESVAPDIIKGAMQVGAFTGGIQAFEWLDDRFQTTGSEHDRMNVLVALGAFTDTTTVQKVRDYILDVVPERNTFIPVAAMAANPFTVSGMWEWFGTHLASLEQMHPLHYERIVAAVIGACGLERPEEVKAFFTDYMAQKPLARDAIGMSLERLEIHLRLRQS